MFERVIFHRLVFQASAQQQGAGPGRAVGAWAQRIGGSDDADAAQRGVGTYPGAAARRSRQRNITYALKDMLSFAGERAYTDFFARHTDVDTLQQRNVPVCGRFESGQRRAQRLHNFRNDVGCYGYESVFAFGQVVLDFIHRIVGRGSETENVVPEIIGECGAEGCSFAFAGIRAAGFFGVGTVVFPETHPHVGQGIAVAKTETGDGGGNFGVAVQSGYVGTDSSRRNFLDIFDGLVGHGAGCVGSVGLFFTDSIGFEGFFFGANEETLFQRRGKLAGCSDGNRSEFKWR